jgi:hypothetical protein
VSIRSSCTRLNNYIIMACRQAFWKNFESVTQGSGTYHILYGDLKLYERWLVIVGVLLFLQFYLLGKFFVFTIYFYIVFFLYIFDGFLEGWKAPREPPGPESCSLNSIFPPLFSGACGYTEHSVLNFLGIPLTHQGLGHITRVTRNIGPHSRRGSMNGII